MDPSDRLVEERIGAVARIIARAEEVEAVAVACETEAREQEQAVERLRARAERLRTQALEYRHAARAIEQAEVVDGVLRPRQGA